jgi:hypothetical protein
MYELIIKMNYIHNFQKEFITTKNFFQISIFVDHTKIVILIHNQKTETKQIQIQKYYYSQLQHSPIIFMYLIIISMISIVISIISVISTISEIEAKVDGDVVWRQY